MIGKPMQQFPWQQSNGVCLYNTKQQILSRCLCFLKLTVTVDMLEAIDMLNIYRFS